MIPEIQLTPLMLIYILSAAVTVGLAVYGILQLRAGGWDDVTVAFVGLVLGSTVWTTARFFELLFVSETLSLFWLATIYIGYGAAGVSVLFFGFAFTGRKKFLTAKAVAVASVLPVVAVVIAATNPIHELFWTGEFVVQSGWWGEVFVHEREFQPAFYAYMIYIVGITALGMYMLVRMAVESPDVYRRQTLAFAFGSAIGLLMGILFGLEAQPFVPAFIDLVPVGWGLMGLCFGYAIFRYQMLDLIPVARDTVIESMRDGYIVLDEEQRIVDLNSAATEIIERDEEIIGTDIDTAVPACARLIDDHEHGTQSEHEIEIEIDGEQRFLVANVSSLYDSDRLIGRLLFIRDITERRSVQKRYQALIENSSDLIIVTDRDGEITYASPSLTNITGADPEAVVGMDAFQFAHEEDRGEIRDAFAELLENPGEKRRIEYRLHDEAGNWLYMEAEIWNLLDDPFVEGIVSNAREITARKEREHELEETNQQLAATNDQLEQFANVISHDLRNPINVAKGHIQIAQESGNEESFGKVAASLDRMEAIVGDMLTLAKQGEDIGETESVDLARLSETAWNHVATDGATLDIETSDSLQADPDRLLQLLENCFRNAVEHAGEKTVVRVGTVADGFYIEDDGPGIPPDRREEIFESGETTNTDGTGLGLSIVQEIANAHGWEITVTDGSDGGARFEFCHRPSDPSAR